MSPVKPQVDSRSSTDGLGTSRPEHYDVKDGGEVLGKSVTITYLDGKVTDITKTDPGQ